MRSAPLLLAVGIAAGCARFDRQTLLTGKSDASFTGGTRASGLDSDIAAFLHRFETNGTPDESFAATGMLTLDTPGKRDSSLGLATQAMEKFWPAESSEIRYSSYARIPGGNLDSSFDGTGNLVYALGEAIRASGSPSARFLPLAKLGIAAVF